MSNLLLSDAHGDSMGIYLLYSLSSRKPNQLLLYEQRMKAYNTIIKQHWNKWVWSM